jgi:glycosyltransferase involved in cell wall biosynthesis
MTPESQMPKILFIHPDPHTQLTPFIIDDLRILRECCEVTEFSIHRMTSADLVRNLRLWRAIASHDAVFCWFGATSVSLMAKLLSKTSCFVVGGVDVVSVPEIAYGLIAKNRIGFSWSVLGFRLASLMLPFSESSRRSLVQLPGVQDGDHIQTLYMGVDTDHFHPGSAKKKQVLTVAFVTESNLKRKGLETYIETARLLPSVSFRMAGHIVDESAAEKIRETAPPNLCFLGPLDDEQLLAEYQASQVYAQLSLHEGFGVSLAEAMSCGCAPVVTDRGAIPEVVGKAGIYVPPEDPLAASIGISKALGPEGHAIANDARLRVVTEFSYDTRRRRLQQMLMGKLRR